MKAFALFLALVPGLAHADSIPTSAAYVTRTGTISTNAAVLYGTSGNLLVPIATDASGNIATAAGPPVATSGLVPIGMVTYNVLSQTATSINLTTSAGASVPCMVCLSSNGGPAAGFKIQWSTVATASVNLTSTSEGHYIAASTTAQCWGPWSAGTYLHIAGVAALSSVQYGVNRVQ